MEVTLREYLERRINDALELIVTRIESLEKAVSVAKAEMDRRLDAMNEFRAALKDQAVSLATRLEHNALVKDVQALKEQLINYVTHAELSSMQADIRDLRESRAKLEGKASQQSVTVATVFGLAGIVLSFIGIVLTVVKYFVK